MQVDQMAVVPEHQHKGIGQKLIFYIRDLCRKEGVNRLQLSVWLDNEAAKAFYEQMDFEGYMSTEFNIFSIGDKTKIDLAAL